MGSQLAPPSAPAAMAPPPGGLVPYYNPNPQPPHFWWFGARDDYDKKNADVYFLSSRPIPTHNYAFAASIFLKTISTNAKTIKEWAILNSGAMSHFLTTAAPVTNIIPAIIPLVARLPNGNRVSSTHTCLLNLPTLPLPARTAHIIPGLAAHLLLLVVTLCNAGWSIIFMKIGCTIIYHRRTIMCGHKRTQTGLWIIPLTGHPTPTPMSEPSIATYHRHSANVDATSSAAKYAWHIHQLLCSLPAATLLHALIKSKELTTILGLTQVLICAHLPQFPATNKIHMCHHRTNTSLTCNNQSDNNMAACVEGDHMSPTQEVFSMWEMFCFTTLADTNTGTMYTDLTGAFPVRSFKNMQYIFVAYVYDLNAIIIWPMPSCTNAAMITAFTEVFDVLHAQEYQPALNVMDCYSGGPLGQSVHVYWLAKWLATVAKVTFSGCRFSGICSSPTYDHQSGVRRYK